MNMTIAALRRAKRAYGKRVQRGGRRGGEWAARGVHCSPEISLEISPEDGPEVSPKNRPDNTV